MVGVAHVVDTGRSSIRRRASAASVMFLSVAVQHSNKRRTKDNLCLKKMWLCRITTLAGNDYRSGASMVRTFLAELDRKYTVLRRKWAG